MAKNRPLNLRKFRGKSELARAAYREKPGRRVLIVCEGSKTEPNYFKAMRRDLSLSSTDLKICGEECGTDPLSIFDYAISICQEDDGFDDVYCVFDKEGTQERCINYEKACAKIAAKKVRKGRTFQAIGSVPCFEYWYLLHFRYTTSSFVAAGNKSSGDMVTKALKREIVNYDKSLNTIYDDIKGKVDVARKNATKALVSANANGNDNPSTKVHILFDALLSLRK